MRPRVTAVQLERAVGGADKLLELADRDRTSDINDPTCQSFINDVLEDANADVNSDISMAVDVNDPVVQDAPLLARYELGVGTYLTFFRGTGGMAIPEAVKAEYERIKSELQRIGERKKGIGTSIRPAASQQVEQVAKSQSEPYYSPRGPRRRFDGWS